MKQKQKIHLHFSLSSTNISVTSQAIQTSVCGLKALKTGTVQCTQLLLFRHKTCLYMDYVDGNTKCFFKKPFNTFYNFYGTSNYKLTLMKEDCLYSNRATDKMNN